MRLNRSVTLLFLTLGMIGVLWGIEPETRDQERTAITRLPKLPVDLRDALQSRDFAGAVKLIDAAIAKSKTEVAANHSKVGIPPQSNSKSAQDENSTPSPNPDVPSSTSQEKPQDEKLAVKPGASPVPIDYLLYLKGRALTEQEAHDAAISTFLTLEKEYPQSPWYARARFGQAAVLAKKRDYQSAGAIYKVEAERLLSAGRRDELTAIYLEFADRYFEGCPAKGPRPKCDPDYTQAINYYQQALQLRPGLALQQRIELQIARCHQELKQYNEAISAYQKFLSQYSSPKTPAKRRVSPTLSVEAQFQLGQVLLDAGQPAEARKTWQDFLADDAVKEFGGPLLAETGYRLARTHGVPQPPTIGDLELGVELLDQFVKKYPKHPLAAEAEYNRAQSYLHHQRHDQAIAVLKGLIDNPEFARAPQVPRAWNLLGQSYRSQRRFDEAIQTWRTFLEKFPTDPEWSAVQQVIIDTEFAAADELRIRKNFIAARKAWEMFLNKYPLDSRAPAILFQFGQMQLDESLQIISSVKSPAKLSEMQQSQVIKLFTSALDDWTRLTNKYPGSNEASQASLAIGRTYEEQLGKFAEAVDAYKKVQGPFAGQAQQRISALTSPQLEIITERKFRSNEKPIINLKTRNLKNVSVKLYRVDLTDYFRKLHLASGVESLDIALIDPDKSFERPINDFQEFRQLDQAVEIPVEGPGVTAVTVSSDKLEATTMVVVSDIDVIVKSSRNELFVFSENMLTGKPAEKVKLLVSDGSKVFAEEITGKDGVLQKKFDELKDIKDLRVFAYVDQHSASSQVSLEGLQFSVGLSAKGYLYTDRPAYRAGQLVNIKGIIRWVAEDRYTFKAGEKYQLDIYDAQGRVIENQTLSLNDFGSFASNLQLPEQAQPGQYRIHVYQPGREQSYETNFAVQEYQLEPIQFRVEVPQSVYYRGESVKGKLVLKYYYGSPIAGRTVQYRLGDDRLWTATTDQNGEVTFDLPTQRYSESQPLQLVASFPERNISTGETLYLATRGFSIATSTKRDVYVTGETFDVSVTVNDPASKPVAADLSLELIEMTSTTTGTGERRVSEHPIKSDEKAGSARHTLRVESPGRYVIRVSGKDRFGHTVSGSHQIFISGDDDDVRLRILADQHNYQAGDNGNVQLHWREKPALSLITFESATILGYQLLELKPGANPLPIQFGEHLAPNFQLSVAVMQGNKYHEARSDFRVARELQLSIKPAKKTLAPGEACPVEIMVTDSQGRPVQAELSLGLIQKNLLERFPDRIPKISTFFDGGTREVNCRGMTSCTFRYQPVTRPINEFLLAERDREKNVEAESRANLANTIDQTEMAGGLGGGTSGRLRDSGLGRNETAPRRPDLTRSQLGTVQIQSETEENALESKDRPQAADKEQILQEGVTNLKRRNRSGAALFYDSGEQARWNDQRATYDSRTDVSANANDYIMLAVPDVDGEVPSAVTLHSLSEINNSLSFTNGQVVISNGTKNDAAWGLQILAKSQTPVYAINKSGELQVVNGRSFDDLKKLAENGMHLVTAQKAAETGYWNPSLVTDADGKATALLTMPEKSTAWVIRTQGINKIALAGKSEIEVVTKEDLFSEILTPMAFVSGDKTEVIAEIHNAKLKDVSIEVKLKTTIGETTTELKKIVEVKQPGVSEVKFPVQITVGEKADFELTLSSGGLRRTVQRTVPIEPDGVPVYATTGGSSAQNTAFQLQFPGNIKAENPSLELFLGPSANRTLLEAVLGGPVSGWDRSSYASRNPIERSVSDVLGGVSLLKMLGQSRHSDSPDARELAGRIQAGLSLLISSQREDGGWAWSGQTKAPSPDKYLTSRVIWCFVAARKMGYAVPPQTFDKGIQFLNSAFSNSPDDDHEHRSILLHALAEAGRCDFAHLNRLHRLRNSLNVSAQLHLTLALIAMDRKEMASEVLNLTKLRLLPLPAIQSGGIAEKTFEGCMPWMHSEVEIRGLFLLATNALTPAAEGTENLSNWLLGSRVGSRWQPEKANGPVIMALADWFGRAKLAPEKYVLSIFVNDKLVTKLNVDPSVQPGAVVSVPKKFLGPLDKPQRINLDLEGRGRINYSAIMTGFVASENVTNTGDALFACQRTYEPAHRMLDGEVIPRGFGHIHGPVEGFGNPLTQLPVGERGEVTIHIWRHNVTNSASEHRDYLVYTEPLPAGVSVLTETIKGQMERYELGPNSITFFVGDTAYPEAIQFDVVGYVPGTYKRCPGILRSFYQPANFVAAKADPLTVLSRGAVSQDVYRLTPEEDYEFGKRYFGRGDFAHADLHLSRLFKNYKLSDIYGEVVQMLFQTSLEAKRHADVVQYFEIIKEKLPDVEISFENILRVASAYREIGEYERSYLVFRATLEAGFERESQIAGFLDERGEFLRSVQVMEQLLWSYPAESYIATATYALAQEVYGKASDAANHEKLKGAGITRVDLIATSVQMLDHFLATWPGDPAADQASFSLANALLDLERYPEVVNRCTQFAKRYPDSKLLDSFWYVIGYSQFAQGQHEAALEMCRKVAEWKILDPQTKTETAAVNRWQSIYIMGQVYHSLGKAAEAIQEYEKVKDRFADAREAIEFFSRKDLSLPEVTTIKPGAATKIGLKFRNITAAAVKVYRIDLLKFGLLNRNLSRITAINLAGIRPYHDLTVKLGNGKDYRDKERDLELPLKDEGAYLVVCQGENLYASGLVLISPLALEVQEDSTAGRLRVTVKDVVNEQYAHAVHVKVIGSANDHFQSGQTDLRGIFVAEGINGTSTVIAKTDSNRYAFFRGKVALGTTPVTNDVSAAEKNVLPTQIEGKATLLEGLRRQNEAINTIQRDNYRGLLKNGKQGIKAKAAY